jgi:hypothetical protein
MYLGFEGEIKKTVPQLKPTTSTQQRNLSPDSTLCLASQHTNKLTSPSKHTPKLEKIPKASMPRTWALTLLEAY